MLHTRLAPTPSGYLHAGNGVSFIAAWVLARAAGGRVLLRIDDLDAERRRAEYLEDIFRTLEWLTLDYDVGPVGVGDFLRRYSQHLRLELYMNALLRLRDGGHLYACACSRRQILEQSPSGRYPGTCRARSLSFDASDIAWRARVPPGAVVSFREWRRGEPRTADLDREMGDFVARQKNGLPAYQIASLVDDLHFGINFIVRGEDLLSSTAAQTFLASLLGYDDFHRLSYWHHALLSDASGRKLSKSLGADALKTWREGGRAPTELYRQAARWLELPLQAADSLDSLVGAMRERGM
jgi:glutamyl/glutaminyl-tRNA synthetase